MEIEYVTAQSKTNEGDENLIVSFVGSLEIFEKTLTLNSGWNARLFLLLLAKEIKQNNDVLSYIESFNQLDFNNLFATYGDMDTDDVKEDAENSVLNHLVCGGKNDT